MNDVRVFGVVGEGARQPADAGDDVTFPCRDAVDVLAPLRCVLLGQHQLELDVVAGLHHFEQFPDGRIEAAGDVRWEPPAKHQHFGWHIRIPEWMADAVM